MERPKESRYIGQQIAAEYFPRQVKTTYNVSKDKDTARQFQHSPIKRLPSLWKAIARQAEAKGVADMIIV